ncbi:MAG: reverse transcriptase domain-containing protein, partial [Pseudomonadota bacterium]
MNYYDLEENYTWEFRNKNYPHFDSYYTVEEKIKSIKSKLENNSKLEHKFYPFIKAEQIKFSHNNLKDSQGKKKGFKIERKPRPIMLTARIDANIYSLYRTYLMNKYKELLRNNGIDDCVIAYRKIPVEVGKEGNKCNIHFANEAIEEIIRQVKIQVNCTAIAIDIKGFFDNLDHKIIRKQWSRVMGFKNGLPDDHYSVYKNVTKYHYIEDKKLKEIKWEEDEKPEESSGGNIKKSLQICNLNGFKNKILPELKTNSEKFGIPQGTTISDVIANIYMIDFDIKMKEFANKLGGYYRRYSDDILFIGKTKDWEEVYDYIRSQVKDLKLNISEKKTVISNFISENEKIICKTQVFDEVKNKFINKKKPFEYLGLAFDGNKKTIRQSTISGYHGGLCNKIRKEVKLATRKIIYFDKIYDPTPEQIYKKINFELLYNKFIKFEDHNNDCICKRCKKKLKNEEYPYLDKNFYSYAKQVANITGNQEIIKLFEGKISYIKRQGKKYCNQINIYQIKKPDPKNKLKLPNVK